MRVPDGVPEVFGDKLLIRFGEFFDKARKVPEEWFDGFQRKLCQNQVNSGKA